MTCEGINFIYRNICKSEWFLIVSFEKELFIMRIWQFALVCF